MENEMIERQGKAQKTDHADSCGCAMGARFMTVGFVVSAAVFGWKYYENEGSFSALIIKILVISFLAAGFGKLIGISVYHLKRQRTL